MKSLEDLIQDYLQLRRNLGFKLEEDERKLLQFAAYQRAGGHTGITVENAVEWAASTGTTPNSRAKRLTSVRQFASWASSIDSSIQVLPHRLLPLKLNRAVPYIYTDAQVSALMEQALITSPSRVALTYQTLIGLLACTGMRVGEALRANINDLDGGVLRINNSKFGKSRLLPLHPSVVEKLGSYRAVIEELHGKTLDPEPLLVSAKGERLKAGAVQDMFVRVREGAGIIPRSSRCKPRLYDLRHTFATNTLTDAYREGRSPQQVLPVLATYLGHVEPANTYWYLEATPELLGEAAGKLPSLSITIEGVRDD